MKNHVRYICVGLYFYFFLLCFPEHNRVLLEILLRCLAHVGSVVEWLKRRGRDRHGLGPKPTCAILLCPWERHLTALSPDWWSWQAVLN